MNLPIGDLNSDGHEDLAVTAFQGAVYILLGNGSGGFTSAPGSPIAVNLGATGIVQADFNGDGKLDLALAARSTNQVQILLGSGNATFTEAVGSPITVGMNPVALV